MTEGDVTIEYMKVTPAADGSIVIITVAVIRPGVDLHNLGEVYEKKVRDARDAAERGPDLRIGPKPPEGEQ